jgi:hypothetical protein
MTRRMKTARRSCSIPMAIEHGSCWATMPYNLDTGEDSDGTRPHAVTQIPDAWKGQYSTASFQLLRCATIFARHAATRDGLSERIFTSLSGCYGRGLYSAARLIANGFGWVVILICKAS